MKKKKTDRICSLSSVSKQQAHELCMQQTQTQNQKYQTKYTPFLSLSLPPMEPPNPNPNPIPNPTSDLYFDAIDSFDQSETLDDEDDSSSLSELIKTLPIDGKPKPHSNHLSLDPPPPPPPSPPAPSPRRRRSHPSRLPSDRRSRILQQLHEAAPESSSASAITLDRTIDPPDQTLESPYGSILLSVAGFVIKAIFFQLNLLITCFGIPVKLLHFSFLMASDPFGTVKRVRNGVKERFLLVWNGVAERIGPVVGSNQQRLGKLAGRVALGCFWSVYVGFILVGILVTAYLGGCLVMRWMVEEPLQLVRELNFDYTKPSPDAVVAVDSRGGVDCNGLVLGGREEFGKQLGPRAVPMNHKLQLVVSLTMPESDYNRKLGMFQVRAEFISASGKITHSSRRPCMLRFKSPHIHFIETFLKTSTLLAGYSSESQILSIKMTGFIERIEPTVCVRVILEQRAEYRPGAGIPEIYAASLKLESQLPLLKRILWNWRRTVFIWVGMMLFFFELLIVLVCCRPLIIPRTRPSSETPSRT